MAAKKGGLGKGLDSLIVKKEEGVVAVNPEQHGALQRAVFYEKLTGYCYYSSGYETLF